MELEWQMQHGLLVNDTTHSIHSAFDSNSNDNMTYHPQSNGNMQMIQYNSHSSDGMTFNSRKSYINRIKTEVDFQCWVDPKECTTVNQKYSKMLNKMFVVPDKVLTVNFSFIDNHPGSPYYIRAQPTFSESEHIKEPVRRCAGHQFDDKDPKAPHVLRCESGNPLYQEIDDRCSVLLPLQHYKAMKVSIKYKFVCKTSCKEGGINRRPIHILFTLEDERMTPLGTCSLEVRISSAPGRDMEKEEAAKESGKILIRKAQNPRKRKMSMPKDSNVEIIKETYHHLHNNLPLKAEFLGWLYRSLSVQTDDPEEERLINEGLKSLSRLTMNFRQT
nr:PREDICTED: cellular tumor antigen p53-like [Bemisia tabaci]XP_018899640.1 PREDICTED: cellular tumor antigen p53-like [Bemisia tabaci]